MSGEWEIHMRRMIFALACAAWVGLATASSTANAGAAATTSSPAADLRWAVPHGYVLETPQQARERDSRDIAAIRGISPEQAMVEGDAANAFAVAMVAVHAGLPEHVFTASRWTGTHGLIELSRDNTEADVELVRGLLSGVKADVHLTVKPSRASLKALQSALFEELLAGEAKGVVRRISINDQTGGLEVHSTRELGSVLDTAVSAVHAKGFDSTIGVHLLVRPEEKGAATGEVVGGAQLNVNVNQAECTSGFPVYANFRPGQYGLVTADHCANALLYGNLQWLWFESGTANRMSGDMQWHGHTQTSLPMFQAVPGVLRTIADAGYPQVGQPLCRYGRNTRECRTVATLDECADYFNVGKYCGLAFTDTGSHNVGGDSGGPWFWGNHAYGVHSGWWWTFGTMATFTPITHITWTNPGMTLHRAL